MSVLTNNAFYTRCVWYKSCDQLSHLEFPGGINFNLATEGPKLLETMPPGTPVR